MTYCGPYKFTAGGCTPKTEVFWVRKPSDASPVLLYLQTICTAGVTVHQLTTDKAGLIPATGYTQADQIKVTKDFARGASCEDPVYVSICKTLEPPRFDREPILMCAPDGTRVYAQNVTAEDAPITTAPVFEFWTIGNPSAPYTGDASLLGDCGAEKVDITEGEDYCLNGVNFTRIDVIDTKTYLPIGVVWLDDSGAPVAQPVGATKGICAGIEYDVEILAEPGCADGVAATRVTTYKFDRATGLVVGTPDTVAPTGFVLGACRPVVYVDRPVCVNTTAGEIWDVVERTETSSTGVVSVKYMDPDTSPMLDVTALYDSMRHGGLCDCCNDALPPTHADLRILKTVDSTPPVAPGDLVTYTVIVGNDGPDDVTNVGVTDTPPASFTIVGAPTATYTGGASGFGGTFPNMTIANLPNGGEVTITYQGSFSTVGNQVNTVALTVPPGTVDTPPGVKTSSAAVIVSQTPAVVTLTKTAPAVQDVNTPATYVITVSNAGAGQANGTGFEDSLPTEFVPSGFAWTYTGGASGGVQLDTNSFQVGVLPAGSTATLTITGQFITVADNVVNTVTGVPPTGNPAVTFTGGGTTTVTTCARGWEPYHEILIPVSTLMGTYGTPTSGGNNQLGFVDPDTGALTSVGTVPGANLNALGLDKATNNAVFLDRNTGRIYTAYSPLYAISNPSVLGAGPIAAPNAIMGALNSAQQWFVGGITGATGATSQINVGVVDPLTGAQTAIPSLTATLNTGGNGYDFDFAPNDDLYALTGLNIYVSTFASGYAGWSLVGTLTGIANTGGSVAYDQGILRGSSSIGQIWAYDISTGITTVTSSMPAGTVMADMSGATDPVCKVFWKNTCDDKFYELNKLTEYVPFGTAIQGGCV